MSQALLQMLTCGAPSQGIYADDVFSAYTYTGNGSTQTITNGIDLAGKGGLVWIKERTTAQNHNLWDSERGLGAYLKSNTTDTTSALSGMSFTPTGMSITATGSVWNASGLSYVSWTFRKAPKFFDVVTWTGNGANRTISHSLGQEVGLMLVKRTDTAADWQVYHRSLANTEYMVLNSTAAKATGATRWNSTTATTSVFSVGTDTTVNASGGTYVAYLFAHDTATDGIVQCGSFTTDGSRNVTVSLGWEPQYLMVKTSGVADDWMLIDTSRGFTVGGDDARLAANSSAAESANIWFTPLATGFKTDSPSQLGVSTSYIYLAIRRPNKPPTLGTQVYQAIARTGTGAAATVTGVGFAPDLVMPKTRSAVGYWGALYDRLRGATKFLQTTDTAAEATDALTLTSFGMDGFSVGTDASNLVINGSAKTYINWCFKRAVGVFDEVCYTGTGVAKTEAHNLGVAPELWIVKGRSGATGWRVGCTSLANTECLVLETTAAKTTDATSWNSTFPTSSVFSLGTQANVNTNTATYIAYLFATKAGISKVGSYTGTATTLSIDCGFTTGARFVLIKRTDSTGDWYVWDTVRGIIAGNDPYLLLNSSDAEVTSTDYIDSYTSGFELSSTAPAAINASGGTFIYLAFA